MNTKTNISKLLPIMLCFFAMGFVDLVGIASNYVKADLGLTDSEANIFPSLVFFWFLIFSVPTGILMNRIGRKRTVLLSLVVTAVSLALPIFGDSYGLMLASFSLLGIGNALMQTSLNPLLSTIISGDRLASSLTFGQFVKAIASFLAPYIAMWGATHAPSSGSAPRPSPRSSLTRLRASAPACGCWATRLSCCASSASCATWASTSVPTPPRPSC